MQNRVIPDITGGPNDKSESGESKYTVASVKRAMELIDVFLEPPHEYGVTMLSQMTGQTKNQTYRLLQTLLGHNVVTLDESTKKYSMGHRILEWGVVAQKNSPIVKVAAPFMDQLSSDIGETIVLTTLADERSAICVDKRESNQALQISARIGMRIPLHAGAGSKCLLANSPTTMWDAYIAQGKSLVRYTDKTLVDPDLLKADLTRIRERGYSVSDEDLDPGGCSVAAPIFDFRQKVVASISIASPKTRFGPEEFARNRQAAMNAADDISRRLGCRS